MYIDSAKPLTQSYYQIHVIEGRVNATDAVALESTLFTQSRKLGCSYALYLAPHMAIICPPELEHSIKENITSKKLPGASCNKVLLTPNFFKQLGSKSHLITAKVNSDKMLKELEAKLGGETIRLANGSRRLLLACNDDSKITSQYRSLLTKKIVYSKIPAY
jgi:hypothetical protein